MGRPRGPTPEGLDKPATRARVRKHCLALFESVFGEPWEIGDATFLLDVGARKLHAQRDRKMEKVIDAVRSEAGPAIRDLKKAARAAQRAADRFLHAKETRAFRAAMNRLRVAVNEARETEARWLPSFTIEREDGEELTEDVTFSYLPELGHMVWMLPSELLEFSTPGSPLNDRRQVVKNARIRFGDDVTPRELAIVGILAGAGAGTPAAKLVGTVRDVMNRERNAYSQLLKR